MTINGDAGEREAAPRDELAERFAITVAHAIEAVIEAARRSVPKRCAKTCSTCSCGNRYRAIAGTRVRDSRYDVSIE